MQTVHPLVFITTGTLVVLGVMLMQVGCTGEHRETPTPVSIQAAPDSLLGFPVSKGAAPGYVADQACQTCHPERYASYQEVGMARSFSRPRADVFIEDFENNHFYHAPSQFHYEMIRRGDALFFKRYQVDERGAPINVFERKVDWILGSGHKTRSYLYQVEGGEMYQLPVGWYTRTQQWGMAPGFDRPDHEDIQRRVRRECMFCHNAYPDVPRDSDAYEAPQTYPTNLPEGTGCQRCHGPGAGHVQTVLSSGASLEAIRETVVNPGRMPPREQVQVCYQCHMLPSVALFGIRRFGRGDYSFRPGEPLSDYMLPVDVDDALHTPDERFEINHHAYRLWRSTCSTRSDGALTCLTCHDPHRKVPPAQRATRYRDACLTCHARHKAKDVRVPALTATAHFPPVAEEQQLIRVDPDNCVACHMPQRRTQDVVQVLMTDHNIRRIPGGAELVAPLQETEPVLNDVTFLLPEDAPEGDMATLYLTIAVMRAGGTRNALDHLKNTLERTSPIELTPYLDLARGQLQRQRFAEAAETLTTILEKNPSHPLALEWMGMALMGQGRLEDAAQYLRTAIAYNPDRPEAHYNLGLLWYQKKHYDQAEAYLERAVEIRSNMAPAWYYLGNVATEQGNLDEAGARYQRALELDPTHTRAYVAIGRVLLRQGNRDEAIRYWRHGVKAARDPVAVRKAMQEK